MSDFYLDVCAEAVTLAVIAASVLSAVCWLTEMTLGRQIGVYAGYVAAPTPTWPESPSAEAIGRA